MKRDEPEKNFTTMLIYISQIFVKNYICYIHVSLPKHTSTQMWIRFVAVLANWQHRLLAHWRLITMFTELLGGSLSILLVCLAVFLYISYLWRDKSSDNYPPGPFRLPVIGNLHQVLACEANLLRFLEKYRRVYGNVSTNSVRHGNDYLTF